MVLPTISLTMMGGSRQTNVIPAEAWANLDVRLLPGDDPSLFLAQLRAVVGDANVSIEPLNHDFGVANSSPTKTPLMTAIREVAGRYFGPAPVLPRLTSGYTENQRFRKLGIVSYGYSPYTATPEEGSTEHADNERIRLSELRRGFRVLFDVVTAVGDSPRPAASYVASRTPAK
jgi:acetylornithine deacetylase/succinyl-diaminopimelate desuccinylase-like protein